MKKIEAIIRREKFPAVDAALKKLGVGGLTVEEVAGRGRSRETMTVLAKGKWTYEEEYIKRLKLEILVKDGDAKGVIDAILANASTESVGEGESPGGPRGRSRALRAKGSRASRGREERTSCFGWAT